MSAGGRGRAGVKVATAAAGILLAALAAASDAGAWAFGTHRRIVADALAALPEDMRRGLEASSGEISDGSVHPDIELQDWENHYTCPDGSCGNAPRHVAASFDSIVRDFSGGPSEGLGFLIAALFPAGCSSKSSPAGPTPEPPPESLAFRLGVIAHYMADVNAPYHAAPLEALPLDEHLAFELDVDQRLGGIAFTFDGRYRDVGGDPAGFVLESSALTRRDLGRLLVMGEGREKALQALIRRRYDRAVNDVVDLWYSILKRL